MNSGRSMHGNDIYAGLVSAQPEPQRFFIGDGNPKHLSPDPKGLEQMRQSQPRPNVLFKDPVPIGIQPCLPCYQLPLPQPRQVPRITGFADLLDLGDAAQAVVPNGNASTALLIPAAEATGKRSKKRSATSPGVLETLFFPFALSFPPPFFRFALAPAAAPLPSPGAPPVEPRSASNPSRFAALCRGVAGQVACERKSL